MCGRIARMKRWEKWLPLGLVLIALLAYSNSFTKAFVFDDRIMITGNPNIGSLLPLTWEPRSIVRLSFRLNYALGGFKVEHYHTTNLLIHIIAGLLLYGVVRRTLEKGVGRGRKGQEGTERGEDAAAFLALAVAAIWLVHPLQTESVTYICQRYESLMGLFYLLCVYAWIRAQESGVRSQESGVRGQESGVRGQESGVTIHHSLFTIHSASFWYAVAVAAFVAGIGTKETIFTLPLMVIVYEYVAGGGVGCGRARRYWWQACLVILLCLVPAIRTVRCVVVPFIAQGFEQGVSPLVYLFSQFGVVAHYLRLVFRPDPLCLDYAWAPVRDPQGILFPGTVIVFIFGATVWLVLRKNPAGLAGAWFFITLAPASSIIPIKDLAFEHRMYLPLAGVIALVVVAGWKALEAACGSGGARRERGSLMYGAAIVCVALGLAALTLRRNADYRSEVTIWRHTVDVRPANLRARVALAAALMAEGRTEEAAVELHDTLRDLPASRAEVGYDIDYVRGKALNGLGVIEEMAGELDGARDYFERAVGIDGDFSRARNNLGIVLEKQGLVREAREQWRETLRRSPSDEKARFCLAASFVKERNWAGAKAEFDGMRLVGPGAGEARMAFAWLLATCPEAGLRDGERAGELLEALKSSDPVMTVRLHDMRGAALAAAGRYGDAANETRKALAVAGKVGMRGTEGIRERLALYLAGKPFVETEQPRR